MRDWGWGLGETQLHARSDNLVWLCKPVSSFDISCQQEIRCSLLPHQLCLSVPILLPPGASWLVRPLHGMGFSFVSLSLLASFLLILCPSCLLRFAYLIATSFFLCFSEGLHFHVLLIFPFFLPIPFLYPFVPFSVFFLACFFALPGLQFLASLLPFLSSFLPWHAILPLPLPSLVCFSSFIIRVCFVC